MPPNLFAVSVVELADKLESLNTASNVTIWGTALGTAHMVTSRIRVSELRRTLDSSLQTLWRLLVPGNQQEPSTLCHSESSVRPEIPCGGQFLTVEPGACFDKPVPLHLLTPTRRKAQLCPTSDPRGTLENRAWARTQTRGRAIFSIAFRGTVRCRVGRLEQDKNTQGWITDSLHNI